MVSQSLAAVETTAATLFGDTSRQMVTLQAVTVLAMSWLPARLAMFEAAHPDVSVNVITGNLLSDFRTVLPGREPDVQIAFGSATDFPGTAEMLFGETLYPVARADVAAAIATAEDVMGHRLLEVATHRSGWHQVLARMSGVSVEDATFGMVDHTPLALMMAAQGAGVALARSPVSDAMVDALGLVRLDAFVPVSGQQHYWMIHPEARAANRATLALTEWLSAQAQGQNAP